MIPPMDYLWNLFPTTEQANKMMTPDDRGDIDIDLQFEKALKAAMACGFDGDSCSYNLFPLPQEYQADIGFIFKQKKGGWTYIVSPFALPWLGEPLNA